MLRAALLICVGVLLVVGCRPTTLETPGQTEYKVRDISFEGNEQFSEDDLAIVLGTEVERYNPFEPVKYLNMYTLDDDRQRLETFYRENGYFDVEVDEPELDYANRRDRVSVNWTIREGAPTRVVDVQYVLDDGQISSLQGLDLAETYQRLTVRDDESQRFSRTRMLADAETILSALTESSYGRAQVEARAWADPERREASVYFFISPGPACSFGDVFVDGNGRIPDRMVVEEIPIRPNASPPQSYRQSLLNKSQRRLYDWNTFQQVRVESEIDRERRQSEGTGELLTRRRSLHERISTVSRDAAIGRAALASVFVGARGQSWDVASVGLDLSQLEVEDTTIDVFVDVVDEPAANYRFGVGQLIDAGRSETFVRANAVWRDVFGPLHRFEADFRLGYAFLPFPLPFLADDSIGLENQGIVTRGEVRYVRPRLIADYLDFSAAVRASRAVELTYDVRTFGGALTLGRRVNDYFRFDFGYAVDFVREDSTVRDFVDRYRIAWFNFDFEVDARSNPLQPRSGAYFANALRVGDPVGGEYLFVGVEPDLRGYIPLGDRLTVGVRSYFGFIFGFPPSAEQLPRDYRFYGGGSTDFRGISHRRLSPHGYTVRNDAIDFAGDPFFPTEELCQDQLRTAGLDDEFSCDAEPIGGFSRALFSLEPRYELGQDWLYIAAFADLATVQSSSVPTFSFDDDGFQLAVGGGLRIATPVGPIRADFGWRVTDAAAYGNPRRFNFYIAVGEAF